MDARQYRDTVYRLRSHPPTSPGGPLSIDNRDSLKGVYGSLVPFITLELATEATLSVIPAGLVFPMGFLLFWAFYYTYYRPGTLEARLSGKDGWSILLLPSLLLSAIIWFIKVTVVEIGDFLFFQHRKTPEPVVARRQACPAHPKISSASPRPSEPPLPTDVRYALQVLGIPESRDWNEIHRRYRELAKMVHPDLNPDLTQAGQRFMAYDIAFKKLSTYRQRYFKAA